MFFDTREYSSLDATQQSWEDAGPSSSDYHAFEIMSFPNTRCKHLSKCPTER
jgi:hypothetical protein